MSVPESQAPQQMDRLLGQFLKIEPPPRRNIGSCVAFNQAESIKECFPPEHQGGAVGALSGSKSGMQDHNSHPRSLIKYWSLNHFAGALNSLSCITGSPLWEATLHQRMPTGDRHILRFPQRLEITS